MKIFKELIFDAAHYLPNYNGKCKNMHGHAYKIRITLEGRIDKESGMLFDFASLSSILQEEIVEKYDHKCLNDLLDNPTAENIAIAIFKILFKYGYAIPVTQVEVWETSSSCAVADLEDIK